jgi:hypothetical protein
VGSAGQNVPDDSVTLWRYLPIGRFLWMIEQRSVYFARLAEFGDPFEASLPAQLRRRLSRTPANFVDRLYQLYANRAVIQCWHENEYESEAMWSRYVPGDEGIALSTNVGRIKAAIRGGPSNLVIARVRYIDHDIEDVEDGPEFVPEAPLFCKRRSYEFEREVRFAILPAFAGSELTAPLASTLEVSQQQKSGIVEFQVNKDWNPDFGMTVPHLSETGGFAIPVDLATLIDRLVVSPRYPQWAVQSLQAILDHFDVPVEVEMSDLTRVPGREPLKRFVVSEPSVVISAKRHHVENGMATAAINVASNRDVGPFTFTVGSSVDWIIGAGDGYLPAAGPATIHLAINGIFAFECGISYAALVILKSPGFVSKRIPVMLTITD